MTPDQNHTAPLPAEGKMPPAETGNASNPSPKGNETVPASNSQLLDEKAETYLRESANIEDMPDPQQHQEAEEELGGEG